jgi:hypothetical protein
MESLGIREYWGYQVERVVCVCVCVCACECLSPAMAGVDKGMLLDIWMLGWVSLSGLRNGLFRRDLDVAAQPCKALEDAFAGGSAAGLDLPDMVLCDDIEVESVRDVLWSHGCVGRDMSACVCSRSIWVFLTSVDVLLVGKD